MTRKQKPSSWRDRITFPKDLTYDIDAPIEDVVTALGLLEKERGFFSARSQDVSIIPIGNEYQFRFRMRQNSNVRAQAEGIIWEDETGTHIEGQAQLSHMSAMIYIFTLLMGIPWAIVIGTQVTRLSFLGMLGVLAGFSVLMILNMFTLVRARQQVIDEIEKAVSQGGLSSHLQKQKRSVDRLIQQPSSTHSSIWDESVSEQSPQQEQSKR